MAEHALEMSEYYLTPGHGPSGVETTPGLRGRVVAIRGNHVSERWYGWFVGECLRQGGALRQGLAGLPTVEVGPERRLEPASFVRWWLESGPPAEWQGFAGGEGI